MCLVDSVDGLLAVTLATPEDKWAAERWDWQPGSD